MQRLCTKLRCEYFGLAWIVNKNSQPFIEIFQKINIKKNGPEGPYCLAQIKRLGNRLARTWQILCRHWIGSRWATLPGSDHFATVSGCYKCRCVNKGNHRDRVQSSCSIALQISLITNDCDNAIGTGADRCHELGTRANCT